MNEKAPLSGLQVLVVEDAFLLALDLSDQLTDSGCAVIGPAASVEQALQQIDGITLDGAVLDVNLRGERSFPIAELLASRGIPFVFLTGYDSTTVFPDALQHAPRLSKPVDSQALTEAVAKFRAGARPDGDPQAGS
ncbi:MAG: response regulator [Mesorhizobium sp.]|nr:MAG: response regulator [Mesorhizobium sp.]